jgi:pimeloyl-ACP methyl ester carboxylesterase
MTLRHLRPYAGLDVTLVDTEAGERSVLVLHGGSGPRGVRALVDHLAENARVLAPTHPGWDGTVRPEWFTGVHSLAGAYLDLLEDEALRDVVVVGHSFGGFVASELVTQDRAHLIGRLVLVDAIGPAFDGHRIGMPQPGRGPSSADGPTIGDSLLTRRLSRVDIPALLIWGAQDPVVPPSFGRSYADALGSARFETVPGAGHVPWLDDPTATFGLIDEFAGFCERKETP